MQVLDGFGISRSLEPKGSLPQPAWKVDNTMDLKPNELLVDVKIISINLVSFIEIGEETGYHDDLFKRRILEIISERGKLHNPITGTGGMLYGQVLELGSQYPNRYGVKPGDKIISLMSLSSTPIRLEKIISIDYGSAQVEVMGKCILFKGSPIMKRPEDLPLKLLVAAMDEAGAPTRTYREVAPGQTVLIMGAHGKVGLMCAYAAKDKLGGTGRLVGLVRGEYHRKQVEQFQLFDDILVLDATDVTQFYEQGRLEGLIEGYDLVVNCINSPATEMTSLILVKNGGTVYFATLSCDYKLAALTAESIGKEVTIIPYTGYIAGHAEYTLNLVRRFQPLQDFLQFKSTNTPAQPPVISAPPALSLPDETGDISGYIFTSKESKATLYQALKVARFNSNVIIYGESGVGKDIIARIIHRNSDRKSFPMVKINCAAIPENLLESELFGYERGSFTGANAKGKIGLWETAQNGTLFLDEVGELPLSFQAKLLRVIQEKEIVRVGGVSPIKVDVRIIAATNRSLVEMMEQRLFRRDLYYRLNVFPVSVLPLRERRSDIIPLANYFVRHYNQEFCMEKTISQQALQFLSNQTFRGNTRELQNLIQRLMITTDSQVVECKDILHAMAYDPTDGASGGPVTQPHSTEPGPEGGRSAPPWTERNQEDMFSLKALLNQTECAILRAYKEKYGSTRKIAEALKISQPSIVRKLNFYGISGEEPPEH